MYKHLLVPLDGSPESEGILSEVQRSAGMRDHVHFLHVIPMHHAPPGAEAAQGIEMHQHAADYLKITRDRRLPNQPGLDLIRAGEPAEEILKAALELNINLIAMTTHGRSGFGRFFMGSVASEVVRKSQLPVLLARPGMAAPRGRFKKILIAIEGNETLDDVLEFVRSLDDNAALELILFSAVLAAPDPAPQWAVRSPLSRLESPLGRLQTLADALEKEGYAAWPLVSVGDPVVEILEQSYKLEVDLIALATHGRAGWERILEGSVAEGVLHRSPVAVLLRKPLLVHHTAIAGGPHA